MMSNSKTVVEEWSVKDLEDGSALNVSVLSCTELGNEARPGLQVCYMGNMVNFEPLNVERWAYEARKAGVTVYLLDRYSWMVHEDQYVKLYLLTGSLLTVKVEVKTRSSKPVIKEYTLPFELSEQ